MTDPTKTPLPPVATILEQIWTEDLAAYAPGFRFAFGSTSETQFSITCWKLDADGSPIESSKATEVAHLDPPTDDRGAFVKHLAHVSEAMVRRLAGIKDDGSVEWLSK